MYCKLKCDSDKFSYLIAKHPDNTFSRDCGKGGRSVMGKFIDDVYHIHIENDPLRFLSVARKMNMYSYIHTQLSAVCPSNLNGFDTIFRSVLRGNFGDLPSTTWEPPVNMEIEIGPYPCHIEQLNFWFGDAGFTVEKVNSEDEFSSCVKLTTIEPMYITEIFQKIYVLSYYMTQHHNLGKVGSLDQITKFVEMAHTWLDKLSKREKVVNQLCKWKKDTVKVMEEQLSDRSDASEEDKQARKESVDSFLNRKSIHAKRHQLILDEIPEDTTSLLELGCGGGKFIMKAAKALADTKMLGLEISSGLASRLKSKLTTRGRKKYKNVFVNNSNIIAPNVKETDLLPDFMVMTEVIEHLHEKDRLEVIRMIKQFYMPRKLVITAPNVEYNEHLRNLEENGYRHRDHKIEYTKDEFIEEILTGLSEVYDVELQEVYNDINSNGYIPVPISWVCIATHKEPDTRKVNKRALAKYEALYTPLYLPVSDYNVTLKEMSAGYSSHAMSDYGKELFYLAPTMAPVEYNHDYPDYLEHPMSAVKYFTDRGHSRLWAEHKYMGSRGYILAFDDITTANMMGFSSTIIIRSRNGFPFFNEHNPKERKYIEAVYNDVTPKLKALSKERKAGQFVMFDAEILPWIFKAKKLVGKEYIVPGECAYHSRANSLTGADMTSVEQFMSTIKGYTQNTPVEVRLFNMLASGSVTDRGKYGVKLHDVSNGYFKDRSSHYSMIDFFTKDATIIKPVERYEINLNQTPSVKVLMNHLVQNWINFTEDGGEGFVIKPHQTVSYTPDGYLHQPALKVRGKKYLQITYGIDYLEPDYFKIISDRYVKKKRIQAITEHELSINMMYAFLNNRRLQHRRFIAAHIGAQSVNMKKIDATL